MRGRITATAMFCSTFGVLVTANAAPLTWTIDANASYVRLTTPDQNLGSISILIRNANGSAWTDAGGRLAQVSGTIASNYTDFASIEFLAGQHSMQAIESGSFRPNPAVFDPLLATPESPTGRYADNSGAPAAFAGRFSSPLLITSPLGFFAIRDVDYDVASGVIPVDGTGNLAGGTYQFGISSALLDLDGEVFLGNQFLPDLLAVPLASTVAANVAGGLIEDLGGFDRRLTLSIGVPITIVVDGAPLNASLGGQIVATATIPEPATWMLAGVSALAIGAMVRRRWRNR